MSRVAELLPREAADARGNDDRLEPDCAGAEPGARDAGVGFWDRFWAAMSVQPEFPTVTALALT